MIDVLVVDTADDADALATTDLETAPGSGIIEITMASTQADTIASISAGSDIIRRLINVPQRTNGEPLLNSDPTVMMAVVAGTKIIVNIDIVTGAVVKTLARFTPGR